MAFTERYAILNDCPLFWDPDGMAKGVYAARYHAELPTRFAVIPRRGGSSDVRWFEAAPTYVLHWINAYEDGDEIVLDGFFQQNPAARSAAHAAACTNACSTTCRSTRWARGPPLALQPRHRRDERRGSVRPHRWSSA